MAKVHFNTLRARELMLHTDIRTDAELARRVGCSPNTITTTMNNRRRPDLETVERIADALGCRTLELLTEEGAPAPHEEAPASVVAA